MNKFYNEGSCATIVAAWEIDSSSCKWMAYGDSVVFHYNVQTGILEVSTFIFWGIFLLIGRLQIEVVVSSKVQETLKV